MVQIQKTVQTLRSSDDLGDLDLDQAVELLGSSLDLSDDMTLMGMDTLFDDVDAVIKDDRDIFMGYADDLHLKNDILMSYDDDSMPHKISDESQGRPEYAELTPDSNMMDSDIVDSDMVDSDIMDSVDSPESMDSPCSPCPESAIPLVALAITGAIPPLKNTRRKAGRRKAEPKPAGVTKRRAPPKRRGRPALNKPRVPPKKTKPLDSDVQCIKVCPPPADPKTNFSPSTMFPTIMSVLKLNTTSAVPLEKLVKSKSESPVAKLIDEISYIQTPPSTPVELKPTVSLIDNPFTTTVTADNVSHASPSAKNVLTLAECEYGSHTDTVASKSINCPMQSTSSSDIPSIIIKSEPIDIDEEDKNLSGTPKICETTTSDSESVSESTDCKCGDEISVIPPVKTYGRSKASVPAPTRMMTRNIHRRRPSVTFTRRSRSSKAAQDIQLSPSTEEPAQSFEVHNTQPLVPTQPLAQVAQAQVTVVSSNVTTLSSVTPVKHVMPLQTLETSTVASTMVTTTAVAPPVMVTKSAMAPPAVATASPVDASAVTQTITPVTMRATGATARTVTSLPITSVIHSSQIITTQGRLPLASRAQITAVSLTTIPARSTILGVLPSIARVKQTVIPSSQPIAVRHAAASLNKPITVSHTATHPASIVTHVASQPLTVASPPPSTVTTSVVTNTPVTNIPVTNPAPALTKAMCSLVSNPDVSNTATISPVKQEPTFATTSDINSASNSQSADSIASRNSEILSLLTRQTKLSCIKIEEEPLPRTRSFSGYSSSSSCSGSPPPHSPTYTMPPTPAVVSIKEEMLSDFSDEEEYERYKKMSPEEQDRLKRRRYNNRVAAQRCRQRKRDYFQGLKKEIQEWECSNTKLRYEIHLLHKELKSLTKVWTDHATECDSVVLKKRKHRRHKKSKTATTDSPEAAATVQATPEQPLVVPILVN